MILSVSLAAAYLYDVFLLPIVAPGVEDARTTRASMPLPRRAFASATSLQCNELLLGTEDPDRDIYSLQSRSP